MMLSKYDKFKYSERKEVRNILTRWTPKTIPERRTKSSTMDLWTARLGGVSTKCITKTAELSPTLHLQTTELSDRMKMVKTFANQLKHSHSGQVPRMELVGFKFWGDFSGPHIPSFFNLNVYISGWLEDATNFGVVHFVKKKSLAAWSFKRLLAACPYKIGCVATDGAKEYIHKISDVCTNTGIIHTWSPTDTPQRNARMERYWRVLFSMGRFMLSFCGGSRVFWEHAVAHACNIKNLVIYFTTGLIPSEDYFCIASDLNKILVFGCTVTIRRDKQGTRTKPLPMSEWGIHLGWDPIQHKHLNYGLVSKTIVEGPDFTPYEANFGAMKLFRSNNPDLDELSSLLDQGGEDSDFSGPDSIKPINSWFNNSQESLDLWNAESENFGNDTDLPMESNEAPTTSTHPISTPQKHIQNLEPNENLSSHPYTPDSCRLTTPAPIVPILPAVNPFLGTRLAKRTLPPTYEEPRTSRSNPALYKPPDDAYGEAAKLAEQNANMETVDKISSFCHYYPTSNTDDANCASVVDTASWAQMLLADCDPRYAFSALLEDEQQYHMEHALAAIHIENCYLTVDGREPNSLEEALLLPDAAKYKEAFWKEADGLIENETWDWCECPSDIVPIDTREVFVRKIQPDGSILVKARIVARGFTQVAGQNFSWDTIYAPVIRQSSIRWMFCLIAEHDLIVTQSDVTQAFLQADLKESADETTGEHLKDIIVRLPKAVWKQCSITGRSLKYGRLQKALYGLKQSPKRWNVKFNTGMTKFGFHTNPADPCIYVLVSGNDFIIVGVYVDDLIKISNCQPLLDHVEKYMSTTFKIVHMGVLNQFIGMQCSWKYTKDGRKYYNVSQKDYALKILKRFKLDGCNPTDAPCDTSKSGEARVLRPNPEDVSLCNPTLLTDYRAMEGGLIYLSCLTRLDISYAVGACAVFMSNPTEEHMTALKRIFRYVIGTLDYSLKYFQTGEPIKLEMAVDANFMGTYNSKSTTGYLSYTPAGIVNYKSKRQSTVATATAHSETLAFFAAIRSLVLERRSAKGFKIIEHTDDHATIVFCDNTATIELVRMPHAGISDRTKHWQMNWDWLHEMRTGPNPIFIPTFIPGVANNADILTKPLGKILQLLICERLYLTPM